MRQTSVRRKLLLAIFGPSFGILLLLGTVGLGLDVIALRQAIEEEAQVGAKLLSLALRTPLAVDDDLVVYEVLSAVQGDPDTLFATVRSPEDQIVAEYPRLKPGGTPPQPDSSNMLTLVQPITVGDETIGTLHLGVSLDRYHDRLRWYIGGAIISVVLLSGVAALVASVLQRQFSRPLNVLANTAEMVSRRRDYSVRAPELKESEFQSLTNAFNHMLSEIQGQTTALTTANAQLKTANAELEAFTYSVSHDLRTPLRAISGYAQIVQSTADGKLPEEAAEYLTRIEANAIRMAELIDDLLAFSRVDARPLAREPVELNALVEEVWAELMLQNRGRNVEFQLDELDIVQADPSLLKQVFTNLLHNALKYSRERPQAFIHVGMQHDAGANAYFVRDNGAGFDMKYATKLFGLFQRLHSQKDFEGTGIGLAIVQRIVTRHGGTVWARAEPDKGATFYFTLG